VFRPLPDSGATLSIVGTKVMTDLNLKYDKMDKELPKLFNASGKPMSITGTTTFLITSEGCETVKITCLVISDMKNDLLEGWKDLQKMEIISANFPKGPGAKSLSNAEEQEASFVVRKAEIEKQNKIEKEKKFKKNSKRKI
jgi:hypothetical protein